MFTEPANRTDTHLNPTITLIEPLELRCLFATVTATVETTPVPHGGDSADDVAIWVHPTDPSRSTVIGTDKDSSGGLGVYDLAGNQLGFFQHGKMNNVDVGHGVSLGGQGVDIAVASNRSSSGSLAVYKINPETRLIENVAARTLRTAMTGGVYGVALYQDRANDKLYAFLTSRNDNLLEQWELFDNGAGKIDGRIVRTINTGSTCEGMFVDDETGILYVGAESVGVWRYSADPAGGTARTLLDSTGAGGHLTRDVEGIALYRMAGGTGYLVVSSQGSHDFAVYERDGTQAYLGRFNIGAGAIDDVTKTDGIEVMSFPLGSSFSQGLFVAQDNANPGANQNFKLVPWQSIAGALSLQIDTTQDPRGGVTSPPPPVNHAPTVNAGADAQIYLPELAALDATISDDGLPVPDGLSSQWTLVSGPGEVTFGDPAMVDTTASFSAPGEYVLLLTASDGVLSAGDEVTINVVDPNAANQAPTVSAGADATVQVTGAALLDGAVGDDGLPLPAVLGTQWTAASGPGEVTFANAAQVDTAASFSADGTYVLRLTATDGAGLSTFDEVTITATPPNTAPTVGAGADALVNLPGAASLDGTVDDDGLPLPAVLTQQWTRQSGPGTVTFANAGAVDTTATFSVSGVYVLRLTATDGAGASSFDEVTITVNAAPTVNAGADVAVVLPNTALLDGTVGDDGLPLPAALTTQWSQTSGPGQVSFLNASSIDTSASFPTTGTYVLRLTATDGAGLSRFDELTITVASSNPPQSGTITFRNGVNGYLGTQDTHLRQDRPSTSFGSATKLTVDLDDNGASGQQPVHGLLRFDGLFGSGPGQVPVGVTITGATLTVYTGSSSGDNSNTASSLRRMLVNWSEASTWGSLVNGVSAGPEASSTADGTVTPSTRNVAVNFNVRTTIQAWAANPAANFGWALLPSGTDGWWWNASEFSTVSLRPQLSVTYQT